MNLTAPCYAVFDDGSDVLVITIREGMATVENECGDRWLEPASNLSPADLGWTWRPAASLSPTTTVLLHTFRWSTTARTLRQRASPRQRVTERVVENGGWDRIRQIRAYWHATGQL